MNAHSAWMKWQKPYRIEPRLDETEREFPCPVRYDWKGVGMEGAFKAGYMASSTDPTERERELAIKLAVAEDRLTLIRQLTQ